MRSSLRALLSIAILSLFLPVVATAEYLGLDVNGDFQCDSIDMVQTAAQGEVGTVRSIDVYYADIPNPVINLGCVFCVGDKNMISNPTFIFSTPTNAPAWVNLYQNTAAGPFAYTLADSIAANYPDYLCFAVSGTDFSGTNEISTFPTKLGTLQYEVAQEGCIQWLFDGPPNLTALTTGFSSLAFDDPGQTCPPRACPSAGDPLAINESTPACPIPNATKGVAYPAGTIFTATGGTPPYTWGQSGLPEGMNINSGTGEIVGTPTQAGDFPFVVTVDDGASGHDEWSCSIFVAEYGVSVVLLSADTTAVGDPDTTIHEFRVQNTGNVQTTFDLSAWSSSGFGAVILGGSTTTLQPGANSSHQVRHLIPEVPCPNPPPYSYDRAYFRAKYSVAVPAPATLADDTASAVVAIAPDAGVSVTYADDSQCITPGTTGTDYFIVENTGECPDTFNLSVSANLPTWNVSIVGNPWIFLVPGNPESIAVSVGVPSSAPCTEAADITFTATARHYWVSMPETGSECAATILDGTLSDESNQVGAPGDTVEYCFMVQNTGNCAASFAPAFQSVWPVLYTGGSFQLQVGQSIEKCVKHVIPGSAQDGNQDQLCVFLEASAPAKEVPVRVDTSCVTTTAGVPCESTVDVVHAGQIVSCFEPGGTLQDTFTVQNTGNCADVFDLTAQAGLPGWTAAIVGSSSISLDPSALVSVYVNVAAPANALCTDAGSVTLTAEGQVYGATETAGSGDYCVLPVITGTVSQPGNQTGAPGDTVLYGFVMKNTGNCSEAFGLQFSSQWANIPGTAEAFLDPGDTAVVSVGHVVPKNAEEGDSDELCATLIPVPNKGGRPSPLDTSCVVTTAVVPCEGGVDITGDTFLHGVPGDSLYADFMVQNLGNGPDRFLLLATSTEGWWTGVVGSDTTGIVAPGAYGNVEVLIVIPDDGLCGAVDHVQLLAQSLCDPAAWDTQSVAVEVDPFCAASVVALTEDSTGTPGQGMDYVFRVTNEGNCQADFHIVVTQSADWDTSYGSTVAALPVGWYYDFPFHVDIPATAQPGDEHKVIVCADCAYTAQGRQPGEACDSTITRVPTGCEADQPVLSLGAYQTVSYGGPGGQWQVQVALKNNGPGKAQSIAAQMHHDLAWLYLVDGMCTYPDLNPGASSYGVDSYTFDLRDYPGGSFNVWFDVTYTDSCGNAYQTRLDPTFSNPGGNGLPSPAAAGLVLHQNVPNPFNPETSISFELPSGAFAELAVYNTAGQSVRTLWAGTLPAGLHTFLWNGENERGTPVPSGTYFYSVRSEGRADTKRMVLVR